MTTTQYRNFIAVAECRSITGAAQELCVAQPSLTNQIKKLEDELGTQLFIRYPRSVKLTEAGQIFYQAAKSILQIEENASIEINNLTNGVGVLRIGITMFMPDHSFKKILQNYYNKFPDVLISLYEENTDKLLNKLELGAIELAVVISPQRLSPDFRVISASGSHLYACRTAGCQYLKNKHAGELIELIELRGVPLSAPRTLYRYIEEKCHQSGFTPAWKAISDSRHATIQLAEAGGMVALLALQKQTIENSNLICNKVLSDDLINQRYLVTLQGRALSTAAQNFIRTINAEFFNE